jgi:hypothetical protein
MELFRLIIRIRGKPHGFPPFTAPGIRFAYYDGSQRSTLLVGFFDPLTITQSRMVCDGRQFQAIAPEPHIEEAPDV